MVGDDRGQALTLEGVAAAILLLAAVGFALQMTAVTPLSASTSSQHVENQLQSTGEGVLGSTAEHGELKEAVLYWNSTENEFHREDDLDVGEQYYRAGPPPNAFGDALQAAFGDRNIAYNVDVHYYDGNGNMATQQMVNQGQPSDHAVSASRTVELTNTDTLSVESSNEMLEELEYDDEFYVPDTDEESEHYNLVRVEVIVWRI